MKFKIILFISILYTTSLFSQKPISRIYNEYDLSEQDVNSVLNAVGDWITNNANYSTNIRDWGDLCTKVRNLMVLGQMPIFSPTGTGMRIGNYYVSEGRTNQNLAGYWTEENLKRQFTAKLKEALDKYTESIKQIPVQSSTVNNEKYHYNLNTIIANKYFAGNWENTKKGIKYWDTETKRVRARLGLIESINKYKLEYGENSPFISKLSELNNQNITINSLIEIGFYMGMDITWLLGE